MSHIHCIIRPVVTEKATSGEAKGKYQLVVHSSATKIDIKNAFKALYGADVTKVNVMHTAGKTKTGRTRKPVTKKATFKKVIVTTKEKKPIDLTKPKTK